MKDSKIEWCHHTVNFWWGCAFATLSDGSLSEECRNCYAHLLSKLFSRSKATWGPNGNRWIRHEAARRELYKLDRRARDRGVRERVFVNSMSDTFEDRDDLNEARSFLWGACQWVTNLDLLLLTKRPQNVMGMVPPSWATNWPAHVWIGTTAGTQQSADERVPHLLRIPARVRFLSCEPLLGPLDLVLSRSVALGLTEFHNVLTGGKSDWSSIFGGGEPPLDDVREPRIHWVIAGGESGAKARPMHPEWARALHDQCAAAGVPFFFKQWGEWDVPVDGEKYDTSKGRRGRPQAFIVARDGTVHCFHSERTAGGQVMLHVGKKAAGRRLDGVEHSEFPK